MSKTAFILGGTGQIGTAAAERLRAGGWEVTTAGRTSGDVQLDRKEGLVLPGEFDALIDCMAFTREHAEQLVGLAGRVGNLVVISSASVYSDDLASAQLPVPIPEDHPTVEPGDGDYSAGKRALEVALLEQDALPATLLRACAIHGPRSKSHVREWYFVKRAQDGRPFVLLAYQGASRFHTTATVNLAELIYLACERPGTRVLNAGDPEPPSVLEISRVISLLTGHERVEYLLEDAPEAAGNPWAVPHPFVVDMTAAARELDYRPVATYPEAVEATVRWLLEEQPPLGDYMSTYFDYEAEDDYVRDLAYG